MTEPDKKTKNQRSKRVRRITITLLLLALTALVIFRLTLKVQIRSRRSAITAKGQPLTLEELNTYAGNSTDGPIPDKYKSAFAAYVAPDRKMCQALTRFEFNRLPFLTKPLMPQVRSSILRHVDENAETLEHLDTATAQSGLYYEPVHDCNDPAITLHVGFVGYGDSDMRSAALLLNLRAILKADENDALSAADSLLSALKVIHSLGTKPTLYEWAERRATSSNSVSTLEYVLNRVDLDGDQLRQISESLSVLHGPDLTKTAFIGERCLVLEGFDSHLDYWCNCGQGTRAENAISRVVASLYRAVGLRDMDQAFYLDIMADAVAGTKLSFPEFQRLREEIADRWDSTSRVRFLIHNVYTGYYTLRLEFRLIARLRCAETALAIERYRLANGRIPEMLSDLVPGYLEAVPEDPFDGKELRYKKLEPGYVVYSVGRDLEDQGGMSKDELDDRNDPHDWPFRVLK